MLQLSDEALRVVPKVKKGENEDSLPTRLSLPSFCPDGECGWKEASVVELMMEFMMESLAEGRQGLRRAQLLLYPPLRGVVSPL